MHLLTSNIAVINPIFYLMRPQVAILTLLAVTTITLYALNRTNNSQNQNFELWKAKYGKSYTALEESYRISIWLKNLQFVETHNQRYRKGLESYDLEMNQFADLSKEEFGAKYLIKYPLEQTSECTGSQAPTDNLPEEVDWTKKGAVTGVKNQGQCGSCWAFSSTGSLEGAHYIKNGKLVSFSEQQLVDCSHGYKNNGCLGGLMNQSFFYVRDHGITTEAKYPYKGIFSVKCHYDAETDKAWTISDCSQVTVNSQKAFKAAVALTPVSVAIEANHASFQLYKSGVYSGNCGEKLDHGVLTVGYGTQEGKKYYKVKNSWGEKWGMEGYILIENTGDGAGKCGIQMAASYPIA